MSENAFLDLDERAEGMTGAVGGSSTCGLGRFWNKFHPTEGLSGAGLAGRGERFLRVSERGKSNYHLVRFGISTTYCTGEGAKGMKLAGSSETTCIVAACTRGDSTLGNGRSCASSALSIPCSLGVAPGILVSSEKAFEVGRDCHWGYLLATKLWKGSGEIRTGGRIVKLYSSLDIEDDSRRFGA